MMDDMISRQAAIDAVKELCEHYTPTKSVTHPHMDFVIEELQNLPSAQERKKGRWKRAYLDHEAMGERPSILYCSVCNQCIAYPVNYCPHCGADMRGAEQ